MKSSELRTVRFIWPIARLPVEKVFKKYKLSNAWAVIILTSIAVSSNYILLPYPFQLNPYLGKSWSLTQTIATAFALFYAVSSYFASYFF